MPRMTTAQREAHNARRRVEHQPMDCEVCGETFTPKRSDAKVCGPTCRQRKRRGTAKRDGVEARVLAQNARMRAEAEAEIAAGNTCPIQRQTVATTDEEFAEWDEDIARANWNAVEAGEGRWSPGVLAAYQRLKERGEP